MTTDIVERLRDAADMSLNEYGEADRYREAADEIERLRASAKAWELIAKAPADWKEQAANERPKNPVSQSTEGCEPIE